MCEAKNIIENKYKSIHRGPDGCAELRTLKIKEERNKKKLNILKRISKCIRKESTP